MKWVFEPYYSFFSIVCSACQCIFFIDIFLFHAPVPVHQAIGCNERVSSHMQLMGGGGGGGGVGWFFGWWGGVAPGKNPGKPWKEDHQ